LQGFKLQFEIFLVPTKPLVVPETLRKLIQILMGRTVYMYTSILIFPSRKIYSFVKMSETLLLGWISGEEAKYMETLKMDIVSDVCTNILRQFLNDPMVPKPKHCIL
jgi:hypothetical protein